MTKTREHARQPAAAEVGVGADAAELRDSRHLHAFAGHRRDPPVDADAEEFAERLRLQREGAGPGQCRQRQHLRRVGFRQLLDARVGHRGRRAAQHHLDNRRGDEGREAGRHDGRIRLDQHHLLARPGQGGERREALRAVVARRGERDDRRRVAPGERAAFGQRRMPRRQRVPGRTVENVGSSSASSGRVMRRSSGRSVSPSSIAASWSSSGPDSPAQRSATAASTSGQTSRLPKSTCRRPFAVSEMIRWRWSSRPGRALTRPSLTSCAMARVAPGWVMPTDSASSPMVSGPSRSSARRKGYCPDWTAAPCPRGDPRRVALQALADPLEARAEHQVAQRADDVFGHAGDPPEVCFSSYITTHVSCREAARDGRGAFTIFTTAEPVHGSRLHLLRV